MWKILIMMLRGRPLFKLITTKNGIYKVEITKYKSPVDELKEWEKIANR